MTATLAQSELLQTILDKPADDAARLVYSDWLEEAGEQEHAEFVRAQLEIVRLRMRGTPAVCHADDPDAPERLKALQRRMGVLWVTHREEWFLGKDSLLDAVQLYPQAMDGTVGIVRRGFVAEVRCELAAWVGGQCHQCEGTGRIDCGRRMDRPSMTCPSCVAGRAPGVGQQIVASHPVEVVAATDVEPVGPISGGPNIGQFFYTRRDIGAELHALMGGAGAVSRYYPTETAARAALSAALLAIAKAPTSAGAPQP